MEELIIVSFTSWPPRFHCLPYQIFNIGLLAKKHHLKFVLVLSEEELNSTRFPSLFYNFKKRLDLEIIIDKGNIKSHKKLIPVLEKYPDASVLIIDDDKMYPKNFISNFLKSHEMFPNDIIVGGGFFILKPENGQITCLQPQKQSLVNIVLPNQLLTVLKPANGCFGVFYPKHTFLDKRFFDRELFMKLSPNSDETWLFLFNVLEDRLLRAICEPYSYLPNIKNSQVVRLGLINDYEEYSKINTQLLEVFPEFYDKLLERYEEYKLTSI